MKVKNEYERIASLEVWNIVVAYINKNKLFTSTTGINYKASVSNESINYIGSSSDNKSESISKQFFIAAYNEVRKLDCINMKNVKPYINRNQSSFVGLLKSAGIIV